MAQEDSVNIPSHDVPNDDIGTSFITCNYTEMVINKTLLLINIYFSLLIYLFNFEK